MRMDMRNKAGCLVLAVGLLLAANSAYAQQGGVSESTDKVVSMNGFSSGRDYIH
jgi:hypothetical protein